MKNFPLPFSKNFSSRCKLHASSFQLSLQIWQVGLQRIWGRLHNSLETHDFTRKIIVTVTIVTTANRSGFQDPAPSA